MKNKKIAFRNFSLLLFIVSAFIACDKDFASLDSDIINSGNATNFSTDSEKFDVIAYTKKLDPVQTNNLPISMLGAYNDPNYGLTTASFVTQVSSSLIDPDFGDNVELDSVVLTIPYFSRPIEVTGDGETIYELDSIFPKNPVNPIKLSIYESNFFLRDFDPNAEFNSPQNYYSNGSASGGDIINSMDLEGTPIEVVNAININLNSFIPSENQIGLKDIDGEITGRLAPSLRLRLDNDFWQQKIIDKEGEAELSNVNNFNNYFRGLYFKADAITGNGNMSLLNLASSNANITLYYTKDPFTEGEDRVNSTYILTFTGNRVSLMQNDFTLLNGNENTGDANLYLKGGEGSVAVVKLFNGEDLDEDNNAENTFEIFKNQFVETDENGKYVKSKRLVNEANLVFYVDQTLVQGEEPNRVFIYDMDNNIPLSDYFLDIVNSRFPEFSKPNHLGILKRVDEDDPTSDGVKYKIKITEHIKNILTKDSSNVKLGLAVSLNVNLENNNFQRSIQTLSSEEEKIPLSSIISPRGTILIGNTNPDEIKRVFLEIFYTEPEN